MSARKLHTCINDQCSIGSIALIHKCHKIYPAHLYASFLSLHNNFHFNYVHAQTVRTRPSPPPISEGLGTRLVTTTQLPKFYHDHVGDRVV